MSESKNKFNLPSNQDLLEFIKMKFVKQIEEGTINIKVSDLLKIMEMQRKLASEDEPEDEFWEMIEKIRKEELGDE